MRKPAMCIVEDQDTDQLAVTAKLISVFFFATRIIQYLCFLNEVAEMLTLISLIVGQLHCS